MKKVLKQKGKIFLFIVALFFILIGLFSLYSYYVTNVQKKDVQKNMLNLAQATVSKCMNTRDSRSCYSDKLSKIVEAASLKDAISVLENVQEKDSNTLYCHFIAHKMTQTAVLKEPKNWLEIFSEIDMAGCSNGYSHGTLEGYLYINPEFELNKSNVDIICNKIQVKASEGIEKKRAPGNCAHAMGHIFLVQMQGDNDKALAACASLNSGFNYPCFRGVFMEATEREALVMHEILADLTWNEKNTLEIQELCSSYSSDIGRACIQSLAPMYASLSKGSPENLFNYCQNQIGEENRELCYTEGAGYMAFLLASEERANSTNFPQLCSPVAANSKLHRTCVRAVTSYTINASPRFIDKLHSFCTEMELGEIELCYTEVNNQLVNRYGTLEAQKFCDNADPAYISTCRTRIPMTN